MGKFFKSYTLFKIKLKKLNFLYAKSALFKSAIFTICAHKMCNSNKISMSLMSRCGHVLGHLQSAIWHRQLLTLLGAWKSPKFLFNPRMLVAINYKRRADLEGKNNGMTILDIELTKSFRLININRCFNSTNGKQQKILHQSTTCN